MSPSKITRQTLDSLPMGFATQSLGMAPEHTLDRKLDVMQANGFFLVILGWADFLTWSRLRRPDMPASTAPAEWAHNGEPDPTDEEIWTTLGECAGVLKREVEERGMKLSVLQPFGQYDGFPSGSARQRWVRAKADRWLALCAQLGVDFLQCGTNSETDADAPWSSLCDDMRHIAELGEKHGVKVSYEPWCFNKRIPSWEGCWEVVQEVNHPFLGLCMDISHIALSPDYGGMDPFTGAGYTDFPSVLERLRALPPTAIHFFEISDVVFPLPSRALLKGSDFDAYHLAQEEPNARWTFTICGRCLPLVGKDAGQDVKGPEDMGGARAAEIWKAVLDTGFRGPCSFEVFEQQYMSKEDPTVPERYAKAGQLSKQRLFDAMLEL